MKRGALGSAALLAASVLSATGAHAAPGDAARLEYARGEGAAACPDRSVLKAAVSKRLGYDPFFPAARQTILVEIVDTEGELVAHMQLVDEQDMIVGSRELREQAGQCDELVAALSLAMSIALDPSAALGEKPARAAATARTESSEPAATEPAKEPARESVAQEHPPKPSQAELSESSAREEQRLQLAARAAFFASLGNAPALAFGFRLGSDLQHGSFRLAAEFSQQLSASKTLSDGARARASLLSGTLAPCLAGNAWAGCGLLNLGSLYTRGEDVAYPSNRSTFYAALGVRFEYTPTLVGRLQLLTQADATLPLTPVSLREAGEEVWRSPIVTFTAGIGLRFRFR